jgi:hypothetical protein
MDENISRIMAAFQLFNKLKCCTTCRDLDGDFDNYDSALALLDEDKMRCFIINCLTALHLIQIQRAKHVVAGNDRKVELVKRKVFSGAVSVIINDEYQGDQTIMDTILSVFPNESRMFEETSWLSMHFAIALTANNQISEDDVLVLLSKDPLGMH